MEHTPNWYDRSYKILFVIPFILLIICIGYLVYFQNQTGDIINRDASLSGGTTVTLQTQMPAAELEAALSEAVSDVRVREISDSVSNQQIALIIDSSAQPEELQPAIEEVIGYALTGDNSSVEFTGSALSSSFYKQLLIAIAISFVLMSIVIFFLFRSFVPSSAVIFAAFADIVMPLAIINYLGIELSAAGIAAFLMLIGYSVDSDILLTTRVLKKSEGTVNSRIYSSFKTGMFMTVTALIAVMPAFFIVTGLPDSFRQIFLILGIGLCADIVNTWCTNASIIKWYATRKGLR